MTSSHVTDDFASSTAGREETGVLDLVGLWFTLRRRWRILLGTIIAALVLTAIFIAVQTPLYSARSSVVLNQRTQQVLSGNGQATGDNGQVLSSLPTDAVDVADTEVEVLKSQRLAQAVVRTLGLDRVPEFNGEEPPHGLAAVKHLVLSLVGAHSEVSADDHFGNAVNTLSNDITVERRGLTQVIDITVTSESPQMAANLANTLASAYIKAQVSDKIQATEQANAWLQKQVDQLRGQVTGAEEDVAKYQASRGLLVATGSQLNEQRVAQLQTEETQAQGELAERQARLATAKRQLAAGGNGETLGEALNSPVIQNLRGQVAVVSQRQADLLTHYGPKYPDVINSQHELEGLQHSIQGEVQRIISSLQSDVAASKGRLDAVEAGLSAARSTLAGDKTAQVGLDQLSQNAGAKRGLYDNYLGRLEQTSTTAGLATPDASIVALAQVSLTPSHPRILLDLVIGLMVGGCLGLGLVALMELLNQGVQTSSQVESKLGEPCAGAVPLLRRTDGSPLDYIVNKPLSGFAESFRKLKVFVQHSGRDGSVQVLAITSALPREGKTTTALCFARSLALSGARVVVVDCDVRIRSLSTLAGASGDAGLIGVLNGAVELESVLMRDEPSGALVLPLSRAEDSQKDLLGSVEMDKLLARLRANFDFVVLDCPPALAISDALSVASKADGLLFLIRWKATSAQAAEAALAALRGAGANVLGVALTQVDVVAQSRYGYGDAGQFYKQYSKYYLN